MGRFSLIFWFRRKFIPPCTNSHIPCGGESVKHLVRKTTEMVSSLSAYGPEKFSIDLKNPRNVKSSFSLSLTGSAFSIDKKYRKISLKPGASIQIPVTFSLKKTPFVMSRNARFTGRVMITGPSGMQYPVSTLNAQGPGYVDPKKIHCCEHPPTRRPKRHNSPPVIERTCYKSGTSRWANTGRIDQHRHITGLSEAGDTLTLSYGDMPRHPDGVIPDGGGSGTVFSHPEYRDHCESSSTFDVTYSWWDMIIAHNADGTVSDQEKFFSLSRTGYHNAKFPDDPRIVYSVFAGWKEEVNGYLEFIESSLESGVLTRMEDFCEYWNAHVGDPEYIVNFADIDYLSGEEGHASLTDDMLGALGTNPLIIYPDNLSMPRTFRRDAFFSGENALCDENSYGKTYGDTTHRPAGTYADWTALCFGIGADELTLAHELFHFAARQNWTNESRAFLVSYLLAGHDPWGEWDS